MIRHAVSEYEPVGSAAEILLQYPFARPDHSFMTDGIDVVSMPATYQEFADTADSYLIAAGVPGMSERTPVIAYGANASPYKLREKMDEYVTEGTAMAAEMQIVPNLRVEITGAATAWHDRPGQSGSVFAELYTGSETEDMTAEAFVQFLTKEQLAAMHASEGLTYNFLPVDVYAEGDILPRQAYSYVAGISGVLLKENGTPAFLSDMTAREAVQFMLTNTGVSVSPERFVEQAPTALKDKKSRQNLIGRTLAAIGLSKSFVYVNQPTRDTLPPYLGRASLTPNEMLEDGRVLVHMLEMDVERLRPSPAERTQRVTAKLDELMTNKPDRDRAAALRIARENTDIAAKLRNRASKELANYRGLKEAKTDQS